jgi:hypothetical protein
MPVNPPALAWIALTATLSTAGAWLVLNPPAGVALAQVTGLHDCRPTVSPRSAQGWSLPET